jgi:arylsulfatase A-like enzyme
MSWAIRCDPDSDSDSDAEFRLWLSERFGVKQPFVEEHMARKITRRQAVGLLTSVPLGAAAWPLASLMRAGDARRPNIIYIMSDDHASHAVSCYGSRINRTPNLDRIAAQGMRFDNCFVTNSLCGPSRAALLTGQYSHINGYTQNEGQFDGTQATFPKMLQQAGYQTAIVGKWHLGSDPTGFDYWNILPGQGVYIDPQFIEMGVKKQIRGYVTDIITELAIDYLKSCDKKRPFCLLYHHKAPHRSWVPDAKHADLYENDKLPVPATFDDDYATRARPAREQQMTIERELNRTDLKQDPPPGLGSHELKEWKYQRFLKDYVRVIAAIDDNVGRLLDYLDESGLAGNTIVIYTSDNGFFLGDHGWFDKRFMYEESLRVPLMVRFPGRIKPGSASKAFIINTDFAPTFLNYAGVRVPGDMQGVSFRPILEGREPRNWRRSIYYHYYEFPAPHHVYPHVGVRTERYKLVHYYTIQEWELFDLQQDPHELRNRYGDPDFASVRENLTAELRRLQRELRDPEPASE